MHLYLHNVLVHLGGGVHIATHVSGSLECGFAQVS